MKLVVVSEFLGDGFLDLLRDRLTVEYDPALYADRARLLAVVIDAEGIIIRNRTRIDRELIAAAPQLKVVGRLGVGLDNIDLDACEQAGILVKPAIGANAVSVAEYVIGAMLVLLRPIYGMTASMLAGQWPRQGHAFGSEIMGKTMGLLGFGSIARLVATRATTLGMRVVAYDPFVPVEDRVWVGVEQSAFRELFATADVVSVHVPLTEQTRNLVDAHAIALMKPTAILINTSRGGTVDESALTDALRKGAIAGAALDVFAAEPLRPEAAASFTGLGNVVLTPHVAGNTSESVDRVARVTVETVMEVLGG
ncbi:MAG: hydroxyacid dehydrogenase [Acidimicrobiia bacterium]